MQLPTPSLSNFKSQAKLLKQTISKTIDPSVNLSKAQELLSHSYGYDSMNHISPKLNDDKKKEVLIVDPTKIIEYITDTKVVESTDLIYIILGKILQFEFLTEHITITFDHGYSVYITFEKQDGEYQRIKREILDYFK